MKPQQYLDEMGADIRNKLGPLNTVICLLKNYELESDPEVRDRIFERWIKQELPKCEESIEYLKNIL
jgi:hypothetical protein